MAAGNFGKTMDPALGKNTRFPFQKTEGRGRKKLKPFREILEELSSEEYRIRVEPESCTAVRNKEGVLIGYDISLPSDHAIVATMLTKSAKDVKWLEQLMKVRGEYAPTKIAETDSEGNDKIQTNITVTVVR